MSETITKGQADFIAAILKDALGGRVEELLAEITEPKRHTELAGFKVGDRVRVLEDGAFCASVKKGDVGTVAGFTDNNFYGPLLIVEVDGITWHFRAEGEHIDVEPFKFKTGDRVRVTTEALQWRNGRAYPREAEKGHIGTVESDEGAVGWRDGRFDVRWDHSGCRSVADASGLELVTDGSDTLPKPSIQVGNVVEVNYTPAPSWNGKGVVTDVCADGYICVNMLEGSFKGIEGCFNLKYVTFVADSVEPSFAAGDRVLVYGDAGTVVRVEEVYVTVTFDASDHTDTFYEDEIESLDEREFDMLKQYDSVRVGGELILATQEGSYSPLTPTGSKVTVKNVSCSYSAYGGGDLVTVEDAEGNESTRWVTRFARV